jgi:TRAP-type mannitol/chloroaromatic compound transport system permease small subunit
MCREALMEKAVRGFIRAVGRTNTLIGCLTAVLPLAITVLSAVEVFMRYVFERPTIWIWDLNIQLFAAMVMLGGGYTLMHGAHISVDFFTMNLPARKRAVLNLITSVLFFISVLVLLYFGWQIAWDSWVKRETMATLWGPPLYTMKMTIPVGAFFMLLQGIAKYLADLLLLVTGEEVSLYE